MCMAPSTIPEKMFIFASNLAHILFAIYEFQINHEKFRDVIFLITSAKM